MVKYYRKLYPSTKVIIGENGNQSLIEFSTLDTVVGFYATEHPFVQSEFERCMREQRYGITEISAEEFTRDYIEEKKNRQSVQPKSWREELSRSQSRQGSDPVVRLGSASLVGALRANGSGDIRSNNKSGLVESAATMETRAPAPQPVTMAEPADVPEDAISRQKFVPNVGKRVGRSKPK